MPRGLGYVNWRAYGPPESVERGGDAAMRRFGGLTRGFRAFSKIGEQEFFLVAHGKQWMSLYRLPLIWVVSPLQATL